MPIPLGEFRLEHFARSLGERFRFRRPDPLPGEDPVAELVLLEAVPRQQPFGDEDDEARAPFTLLFELEQARPLSVHTHHFLGHGDLEATDILLTRVAVPRRMRAKPQGMFYEAVFA